MNKVYVLIDEWSEPFGFDQKIFVFSTLEKAKQKMETRRSEFLSHENHDFIEENDELYKRRQDDDIVLCMSISEEIIDEGAENETITYGELASKLTDKLNELAAKDK